MRVLPRLSGPRLALTILALLIIAPAWAEDPVAEYEAVRRASLKGIESLEVIVFGAKTDLGCRHASTEHIQTEVEAQLERAGIRIGPGTGSYLLVTVTSIEHLEGLLCGFAVSVEVQQVVLLARDTRIITFGMTWQKSGLGVAATAGFPESLRHLLAELVDEFVTAYLEENPKSSAHHSMSR